MDRLPRDERFAASLGIRPAEFWPMTPAELDVMRTGFQDQRNRRARELTWIVQKITPQLTKENRMSFSAQQLLASFPGYIVEIEDQG